MSGLLWLVPLALGMGVIGLFAFLWSMKSGQLEDLDGAAVRMLLDKDDTPLPSPQDGRSDRNNNNQKSPFEENEDDKHL